jgi:hypothetical protein
MSDAAAPTLAIAVHVIAALFWGFVGLVAGEMSIALTVLLLAGSGTVATGLVLFFKKHALAKRVLIVGDAVPLAVGIVAFTWLVNVAAREGTLGQLVADSGAALALYLPASIGPLLLAASLPPRTR